MVESCENQTKGTSHSNICKFYIRNLNLWILKETPGSFFMYSSNLCFIFWETLCIQLLFFPNFLLSEKHNKTHLIFKLHGPAHSVYFAERFIFEEIMNASFSIALFPTFKSKFLCYGYNCIAWRYKRHLIVVIESGLKLMSWIDINFVKQGKLYR